MEQSDTLGKMQMSLTNGVLITLSMILKLDLAVTPLLQREINRLLAMDKWLRPLFTMDVILINALISITATETRAWINNYISQFMRM